MDLSAAARWNFSCRRLHITSLFLSSLEPLSFHHLSPLCPCYHSIAPFLSPSRIQTLDFVRLFHIEEKKRDQHSRVSLNSLCARVTRLLFNDRGRGKCWSLVLVPLSELFTTLWISRLENQSSMIKTQR